jgi:hypothetical protein
MRRYNFPAYEPPKNEYEAPTEVRWGEWLRQCGFSWSEAVSLWNDPRCAGRDPRYFEDFADGYTGDRPCVHFVGFRGEEYWSAVRLWGRPDYIWPQATFQMLGECAPQDTVVFGPSAFNKPKKWRAAT